MIDRYQASLGGVGSLSLIFYAYLQRNIFSNTKESVRKVDHRLKSGKCGIVKYRHAIHSARDSH